MKVLGVVCSPRKGGNTEIMMNEALIGARSYGAETELWTTAGKELKPCDGCNTCSKKNGECHIKDDVQELYTKILAADGIIFGSPSYFMSVTAQAKIIIDRLYSLFNIYVLPNKVAGVISVATGIGHEAILTQFVHFFSHCHMLLADHVYGFASAKGDIRKDSYAMKGSEEMGRQVVSLVKQQFRWPEEYRMPLFRFCKERYGIETYPLKRFEVGTGTEDRRDDRGKY